MEISHSWIGDLQLELVSPTGTRVLLRDPSGGSQHDLAATYTAATTPALAGLAGQAAAGNWHLVVKDTSAQDVGKLNGWRLKLDPP